MVDHTKEANMADDVDPDVRSFVNAVNKSYAEQTNLGGASLSRRREIAEHVRKPWANGGPEMVETKEFDLDGVRLRLYRPSDEPSLPTTLYVHGGGWMIFSINTHDRLMREYAKRANCVVFGIDYSLSPEAKFPTALNEIVKTVGWIRDNADELGVDAKRVAIGGDSAGANLSVAACIKLRDSGLPRLQAMILNYGAFDPEPRASYNRYDGPTYSLNIDEMDDFWANYVDSPAQLKDPLVAVSLADVHDLPPAFVAIAECDILADCNRELANKLEDAGVPTKVVVYEGATHSFLEAVSIAPLAQRALDEQAEWLTRVL